MRFNFAIMHVQECETVTPFITNDYEWIRFNGQTAYVGVCDFKLAGLRDIQKIEFFEPQGRIRQGQLLANIISDDYRIPVHMPVDGWFIETNNQLVDFPHTLLTAAETSWMVRILPGKYAAELLHTNEYFTKHRAVKHED